MASTHTPSHSAEDTVETVTPTKNAKENGFKALVKQAIHQMNDVSQDRETLKNALKSPVQRAQFLQDIESLLRTKVGTDHDTLTVDDIEPFCKKFPGYIMDRVHELVYPRVVLEKKAEDQMRMWFDMGVTLPVAVQDMIRDASSSDLQKMSRSMRIMEQSLTKIGVTPTRRNITRVLSSLKINAAALDPDVQTDIHNFIATGYLPEETVSKLLDLQKTSNINDKRALVEYFLPQVSLALLVQENLITDAERDILIKTTFFGYLHQLGITITWNYLNDPFISQAERDFRQEQFEQFSRRIYSGNKVLNPDFLVDSRNVNNGVIDSIFQPNTPLHAAMTAQFSQTLAESYDMDEAELQCANLSDVEAYLKATLTPTQFARFHNFFSDFASGKYIISHRGTDLVHWHIDNDTAHRDGADGIEITAFDQVGRGQGMEFLSYTDLARSLQKEASLKEVTRIEISGTPMHATLEASMNFVDRADFQSEIDKLDTKNTHIPLDGGVAIAMKFGDRKEYFRILDIDDTTQMMTLMDSTRNVMHFTWAQFVDIASKHSQAFERLGNISTPGLFAKNAQITGLSEKKNKLHVKAAGSSDESVLWGFAHKEKKEWIEVKQHGSEVVLYRYRLDKEGKPGEKPKDESLFKSKVLDAQKMPLEFLKEYLENEEFTKPLGISPFKDTDVYKDDGKLPPTAEKPGWQRGKGSIFGMKWTSIGAVIQSFKMGKELLEYKMDEKKKLQSTEFFYKMAQKFGAQDGDWELQAMSQFANNIGELIEKRISRLEQLSADPRRREIRKILLTKPPKAFDLLAAMIVTVKMSGHLYPDSSLQDLQGHNYLWFRQLCTALGYNYNDELQKAIKKEREENSTTAEHISESILITRFLKTNSGKNPYIQAIRGGSKFWGAIPAGRNDQIEKGEKEVQERAKAGDKKNYIMSKYKSNELEIVVGAFPKLWQTDASPEYLAPAFVWTMSNATRIAHPELLQKFKKGNVYGEGFNFHAAQFGESNAEAKVYQNAVTAIVKHLSQPGGPLAGKDAMKVLSILNTIRDGAPDAHNEHLYRDLGKFWETHCKVLHPVLQGASPELFLAANNPALSDSERQAIRAYIGQNSDTTSLAMESFNKDMLKYGGYNYETNFIFSATEDKKHVSLAKQLKHIKIETDHVAMGAEQKYLWEGSILQFLDSLRTSPSFTGNPAYQQSQFEVLYREIMQFVSSSFVTMTKMDTDNWNALVAKQAYLQDLVKRGFDLSYENIFKTQGIDPNAMAKSYTRFKNGIIGEPYDPTSSSTTTSTSTTTHSVQSRVRQAMKIGES